MIGACDQPCSLLQSLYRSGGTQTSTQFYLTPFLREAPKDPATNGARAMTRQKKTVVCPLGGEGVGGKWKYWILYHLLSGTRRFGEMQRLVRQMETWGKWYGEQIGPQYDWVVSLGGRWKFWIWYHLLDGPKRFGEVQRLLPQASRQMLSIQLRQLEQMGVLKRQITVEGSPKVDYALTELGQRSEPMLRQMYVWGRWCCDQLGVEYDWPVSCEAEERMHWQTRTMTAFD